MITVEFHGAAGTVTGSNFLVKTSKVNFIVDCGMFQGPDVEHKNLEPYTYDASSVDFALLTHAHADHSAMLPKLYRSGFRGPIYSTSHTIQIANLLLLDSAKIQENNYQKGQSFGKYTNQVALAYTTQDATETIGLFKAISFNEEFEPADGIKVKFIRAGHVLGAASIEVDIEDEGEKKVLLFSGDIGRKAQPLIEPFDLNYKAEPDYVFIESLYGGVEHPEYSQSVNDLVNIINETIDRNGNVYIPCFAVQRTQEILFDIKEKRESGELDESVPVWLDSPLAQRVSEIYTAALEDYEENSFYFDGLKFVQKYRQSLSLAKKRKQVVIAGSGMAEGGRIVDHLATGLSDSRNSIIFVGFQAEGTLGRELVEGAKFVNIGKTKIKVRAKIHHLHGFSAHGDNSDYLEWIERFKSNNLKKVFLIHAEKERAEALDRSLKENGFSSTEIPTLEESVKL